MTSIFTSERNEHTSKTSKPIVVVTRIPGYGVVLCVVVHVVASVLINTEKIHRTFNHLNLTFTEFGKTVADYVL